MIKNFICLVLLINILYSCNFKHNYPFNFDEKRQVISIVDSNLINRSIRVRVLNCIGDKLSFYSCDDCSFSLESDNLDYYLDSIPMIKKEGIYRFFILKGNVGYDLTLKIDDKGRGREFEGCR